MLERLNSPTFLIEEPYWKSWSFSKMLSPHQNHVPVTPFRLIPGPWCRGGRFSGNCSFLAAFCPFCRSHQLPVVNHQGGRRGPHLLMREATNWRLTWGTVARKSPGDDGGVMEDDGNRPNMIFNKCCRQDICGLEWILAMRIVSKCSGGTLLLLVEWVG